MRRRRWRGSGRGVLELGQALHAERLEFRVVEEDSPDVSLAVILEAIDLQHVRIGYRRSSFGIDILSRRRAVGLIEAIPYAPQLLAQRAVTRRCSCCVVVVAAAARGERSHCAAECQDGGQHLWIRFSHCFPFLLWFFLSFCDWRGSRTPASLWLSECLLCCSKCTPNELWLHQNLNAFWQMMMG